MPGQRPVRSNWRPLHLPAVIVERFRMVGDDDQAVLRARPAHSTGVANAEDVRELVVGQDVARAQLLRGVRPARRAFLDYTEIEAPED